jgi:hypothetical protein
LTTSGSSAKSFLNCVEFFKILIPIKLNGFLNGLSLSKPHRRCFLSTGQRWEHEFLLIDSYPVTSFYLRLQTVVDAL